MMKKVLITGGAGFIGSHLTDRLLANGFEVGVFDNFSSGRVEFISRHQSNKRFKLIEADLLDLARLKDELKGYDLVFHLAANPDIRYGIEHTETDLKQNTIVTYNVLEAMRLNGVKEITFASTSTVYGEAKVRPTPEDYGPLLPISLYGASKLACEALCTSFSHTFGLRCWIFRFANIVGGRETHGIIFDFIKKLQNERQELEILGNGKQVKSYLLIDDCVEAMLYVYQHSREQFNIFNLGCRDQIDITTLARILLERAGLRGTKLRFTGGERGWPGDVPQMSLAVAKLAKLGWQAKHSSREAVEIGIERMLKECKL